MWQRQGQPVPPGLSNTHATSSHFHSASFSCFYFPQSRRNLSLIYTPYTRTWSGSYFRTNNVTCPFPLNSIIIFHRDNFHSAHINSNHFDEFPLGLLANLTRVSHTGLKRVVTRPGFSTHTAPASSCPDMAPTQITGNYTISHNLDAPWDSASNSNPDVSKERTNNICQRNHLLAPSGALYIPMLHRRHRHHLFYFHWACVTESLHPLKFNATKSRSHNSRNKQMQQLSYDGACWRP